MNLKAQMNLKGIWILFGALLILTLVVLISPFQEILNPVVGATGLNCSVPTDGYRSACIVVKGSMLWFILGVGYAVIKGVLNKIIR